MSINEGSRAYYEDFGYSEEASLDAQEFRRTLERHIKEMTSHFNESQEFANTEDWFNRLVDITKTERSFVIRDKIRQLKEGDRFSDPQAEIKQIWDRGINMLLEKLEIVARVVVDLVAAINDEENG